MKRLAQPSAIAFCGGLDQIESDRSELPVGAANSANSLAAKNLKIEYLSDYYFDLLTFRIWNGVIKLVRE